jgi:hypothetical protein
MWGRAVENRINWVGGAGSVVGVVVVWVAGWVGDLVADAWIVHC